MPDPQESPVRKLLYELFLTHRRKRTVAKLLNDAGYRTRNGSKFSNTTVYRLLQDPTAKGLRRSNYTRSLGEKKHWTLKPEEDWIFTDVEPIVSKDVWEQCNQVLRDQQLGSSRPARKTVQLFSGVAFCSCRPDQKMYVPSNTPKYVCQKCRNKISIPDLEAIFHASSGKMKDHLIRPSTKRLNHLNIARSHTSAG